MAVDDTTGRVVADPVATTDEDPPAGPEPVADDPLWAPEPTTRSGRRALSRAAIVDAAVEIADHSGLDAVSMPRLARRLGSAPMSLYRHVPHKDALVDLALDAAVGAPPDVRSAATLREGMARWARANRAVFVAHPWTLPLVSGDRRMGPAECAWAEAFLGLAEDTGIDSSRALAMLHTLNAYVRGASAPIGHRAPSAEEVRRSGRASTLPLLLSVLPESRAEIVAPGYGDEVFEAGLASVLDGLGAPARA